MECVVREAEGDDVQETLHLMDDCVCEGEGLPVLHVGTKVLSNHSVNLLLHLLCTVQSKTYVHSVNVNVIRFLNW